MKKIFKNGALYDVPVVEEPPQINRGVYRIEKLKAYNKWLSSKIEVPEQYRHLFEQDKIYEEGKDFRLLDGYDPIGNGYPPKCRYCQMSYMLCKCVVAHPIIKEESKEAIEDWVSVADYGYPEHNVGVLVFIPKEDFHITSGMWDVSNKWVLLDEYRVPDCEVTHWMKLPAIPKEYQKEQAEYDAIMDFLSKYKDQFKNQLK
jgi:hypothetical protein